MKKIDYKNLYERAFMQYWAAFDRDDQVTMQEAEKLMVAFGKHLIKPIFPPLPSSHKTATKRKNNPVPQSVNVQIKRASQLYENFSGHEAEIVQTIAKPDFPDVLIEIGDIDGIMYTTTRDGQIEKYIHKFHKDAKPLFCSNADGTQIFLLGGEYDFTERGIVDRTDPKQQE